MADSAPLRLCMFSNLFPPLVSGSSSFSGELSRRLVALGHHVTVVTARVDDLPAAEEQGGVRVFRLPALRLPQLALAHNFKYLTYTFTPGNQRWLRELFARERFDVIHQQNHIFDTMLSSRRLARRLRLPLVLTIHTPAQHPNRFYDVVMTGLDALARQVIFKPARFVVSPDPVVAAYVRDRHGIADSPVIPYGIEVPPPRAEDIAEMRRRFAVGDGPLLLSLGHVHELRDRLDVVQAMPRVLERFPTARLLIVGEVYTQRPVARAAQLGISDKVIFAGPLPHHLVSALFAISALETHTFNGPYPGPGIASMEAMSAGLPVVTMTIGPQYDFSFFKNWENVVMVPANSPPDMADALIRLLGDAPLRQRIGAAARELMAGRFSWQAVATAYVDLYRRAIAAPR